MASNYLTISSITQESAPILSNSLGLTRAVTRKYDPNFGKSGAQIGNVINVRKPPRYVVSSGPALQLQDTVETYMPVTITDQLHVDVAYNSFDWSLNVGASTNQNIIKAATTALANKIDDLGFQKLYKTVYNHVGTPGTLPASASPILAAGVKLANNSCPIDGNRAVIVDPSSQAALVGGLSTLFNPSQTISKQFTTGQMGDNVLGFNFAMSQNTPIHAYGTQVAAMSTSAAVAGLTVPTSDGSVGYSIPMSAITGTLTAGTVLTFANVFSVNPQSRRSTGQLAQFVVTADTLAGATSVSVFPAPIFSGQFQNCTSTTNTIASGAAVNVPAGVTASQQLVQNLAFHPNAFTMVTADLELPGGNDTAARTNMDGISMRVIKTYVPQTDQLVIRFDTLVGWAPIYPELACRITG